MNDTDTNIKNFWGSLYSSLYDDIDARLTPELLRELLIELEDMFRFREHMAVHDMPLTELSGKKVLEIGSGAGGHSALFAKYGANMTSVDITFSRVKSTQAKLALLARLSDGCSALQSSAESLPFESDSFDIVYSNGVLHHANNTVKSISEVHRVLKPGGKAVIMLYCKSSWHYWFNMVLCVGILQGKLLSGKNWLGRATEWGGKDVQTVRNPITRCFTKGEIHRLFERFQLLNLRKREFYFYLIPKLGKIYRRWQIRKYGAHDGGYLVYGEPWPIQSPLELKLGRYIGWAWFITAEKPLKSE